MLSEVNYTGEVFLLGHTRCERVQCHWGNTSLTRTRVVDASAARSAVCLMCGVRAHCSTHLLPSDLVGTIESFIVEYAFADLLFDAVVVKSVKDMKWQVEVMLAPMAYEVTLVREVCATKITRRSLRDERHPRPHMT